MAILIDENTRVLVQGITGRTGEFATRYMLEYGTKVVAGVTPGRGGTRVWGVPVFDSVKEALRKVGPIDASITLVPPAHLKEAVMEAIDSGIGYILIPTERVPVHDAMAILARARRKGTRVQGPGSFGVISPGKAVMGWIGGSLELAREAFIPGKVGIISRSGGQTTTTSWAVSKAGFGISTAVHTGSEPLVGLTETELLSLFEKDDETKAVVLFAEIGGVQEEEAAEFVERGEFTKPLIAYVAGRMLPTGIRFSHASAIVTGDRGSADSKIRALKRAGALIAEYPKQIASLLREVL